MGRGRGNRPVVCVETGERFGSVGAAARHIGAPSSAVSQAAAKGCAARGLHFYLADGPRPPEGSFKPVRGRLVGEKMVPINVMVPKDLRDRAKMHRIETGESTTQLVRRLLERELAD